MYLSVENGDYGILTDAHGNPIRYPLEADTESGKVIELRKDENGEFIYNEYDDSLAQRFVEYYPAPLVFTPSKYK